MGLRLTVSDIWKTYNGDAVLKGCSFSFDSSGIYVLMGPNGCGKSTFLRICSLLEEYDKGEINYFSDNNILEKDIGLRRRISLVLPKIGVFNTTVYKNVEYGLKIRGMTGKETEEKVDRALDFVGLHYKKKHNALILSSGEIQRLGIARAFVIEPEILFLDEPTASIDQKNTEIIEDIILKMKREGRAIVVITTHDKSQAEKLADKILIMQNGSIIDTNS